MHTSSTALSSPTSPPQGIGERTVGSPLAVKKVGPPPKGAGAVRAKRLKETTHQL